MSRALALYLNVCDAAFLASLSRGQGMPSLSCHLVILLHYHGAGHESYVCLGTARPVHGLAQ